MYPQTMTGNAGQTYIAVNAPAVQQAQPVGHIVQGMEEFSKLADALAEDVSLLEHRLGAVLRPSPPQTSGPSDAAGRPSASALGDGLAQFNTRLYGQIQRLREIAARLDL